MTAVFFDFDGTLVESYESALLSYVELFREIGYDFDEGFLRERFGRGSRKVIADFLEKHNIPHDEKRVDELTERKGLLNLKHMGRIRLLPGVKRLLEELKDKNVCMAITTSNTLNFVRPLLKKGKIDKYFKAIVTREDFKESKPSPDIYLKAAGLLNKKPERCFVVEDSAAGIQAAKRAGMHPIAVASGQTPSGELEKERPELLVGSLKDIEKIKNFLGV
ncbi:HAD family phosphatase [Candidatus Woesearchaeota archaeon]|nr:HAD family phosphatase [Candidatus Woesearchaeota archaeon]